jgi:hypothetical protein
MQQIGGTAASPGNPAYSFTADNPAELLEFFDEIIGSIVCRFGPLGLEAGARSEDVGVWTRAPDGTETEVKFTDFDVDDEDLPDDFQQQRYFEYLPEEDKIRMNQVACDLVVEDSHQLVLRYGRVSLVR